MFRTIGRNVLLVVCLVLGSVMALQALAVACLCVVLVLSVVSRQDFRRCCVLARRAMLTGQAVLHEMIASWKKEHPEQ